MATLSLSVSTLTDILTDYYIYYEAKNDTRHVFLREVESAYYTQCSLSGFNQLKEMIEPTIITQGQASLVLPVAKARVCSDVTLTTAITYTYP